MRNAQQGPGRRKFLRHLGMTAAATAALAGIADVAGLTPASAATGNTRVKKVRDVRERAVTVNPNCPSISCLLARGRCGAGCTPTGVYCHTCFTSAGHSYNMCIGGNFGFFMTYC